MATTIGLLLERAESIKYPCYLVVYGPAREYRTRFRMEHPGVFFKGSVQDAKELTDTVGSLGYAGGLSEMEIVAITVGDDSNLDVKEL
jgi:hypothetical protein